MQLDQIHPYLYGYLRVLLVFGRIELGSFKRRQIESLFTPIQWRTQ